MTVSEKDRLEHHYKYEQDMLSATFAKLSPELDCVTQNALKSPFAFMPDVLLDFLRKEKNTRTHFISRFRITKTKQKILK